MTLAGTDSTISLHDISGSCHVRTYSKAVILRIPLKTRLLQQFKQVSYLVSRR